MIVGVVGQKIGMTRLFREDGKSIPVTVIKIEPNFVSQVKNPKKDGYSAIQVTSGERRSTRVSKPIAGHMAKAKVRMGRGLREFKLATELESQISELRCDQFDVGQKVDVTGRSKGKGFSGAVKRWNFKMQDATHGNSLSHRAPGSIGNCQTPGRVFKGKKMAGHMGDKKVTVQGLEIVQIDSATGIILIGGAVPGARGGEVVIRPAIKSTGYVGSQV